MGRVVALDFGMARIGVAISDRTYFLASSLGKIDHQKDLKKSIAALLQLLASYIEEIELIVLGNPLHLNGNRSVMSDHVLAFKTLLESETSYKVILWDERLSSMQAERLLREDKMRRRDRKEVIDGLSAAILLQSYLDTPKT